MKGLPWASWLFVVVNMHGSDIGVEWDACNRIAREPDEIITFESTTIIYLMNGRLHVGIYGEYYQ